MPKRATLTYSSEDANTLKEQQVFVYYCKYSGKHALTTDVDLALLPLRPADSSRVMDTNKFMCKVYADDGGLKVIRRKSGKLEKQYRLNIGRLPVAYRSDPDSHLLYILDNAVSVFSNDSEARPPVPPCILKAGDKVQVALEIEDAAENPAVVKVTADSVLMRVTGSITGPRLAEELLEYTGKVLTCRPSQLTLMKGWSARSRLIMVEGKTQEEVFHALISTIKASGATAGA
mmetsp:Transcript_11992/g.33731  ORF Transcript_11992/g.33731 Transcript_11992/m.33731 type:complete len:232 (+) Transcript_11992:176-871(+)|eukprot:CAMPEP_0117674512 /NCGR_PEP_ID=MMETSP0804-20121206/15082_1 /TAXON_ID=1074897 /ORGANISM="Tetraselmis astigmatica, Strain CCMP880" /LENGTH=231 /DNA_ID=CAMNT_0005483395 /DNA_START=137 /DNA_END=832 /DNA_ORIENTATION=-